MIEINRVLVPIDFSECSLEALKYGQELCDKFDAELHLLHILEVHMSSTPQFIMGLAVPERKEESLDIVVKKMSEYPAADWASGRAVTRETGHGSPFVEIVKYAKDHQIDAIVIGTHGRTGLRHVFMGSVAENVVRHAPCPVMIVREQGHQFEAP